MNILYEDDELLAVDKPAGMVVHPTYKNRSGTLLDALLGRVAAPSIVGRLDRLVSGIVIVAKGAEAHARLQRAMTDTSCEKSYVAVVAGLVQPDRGSIDLGIRVDPADRRRVIVSETGGAASLTSFERIASAASAALGTSLQTYSLARCRIFTGRRHQIRAHLAARGWPIVGDPIYGTLIETFPRIALHAHRASFTHPATGAALAIESPLPSDLMMLLSRLGLGDATETPGQASQS
ncbi:MAG TPA: RluA family pseudouridine synthase [Vicinamibacterales bacterium]